MKNRLLAVFLLTIAPVLLAQTPRLSRDNTTFILPQNDGEAVEIQKYLKKNGFHDLRLSQQSWGASLDKEPADQLNNLKKNVVVVEMPSPEAEQRLRDAGHNVIVVDHHDYSELIRSNPLSSIEQIAAMVGTPLNRREKGVALNDRGYIYAMADAGYSVKEIEDARIQDLKAQGTTLEQIALQRDAFQHALNGDGLRIATLTTTKTGFLSDLNSLGDLKNVRDLLVVSYDKGAKINELNFFGSPAKATALKSALGGWSGGDPKRSMFWGASGPDISWEKVATAIGNRELLKAALLRCEVIFH